MLAAGHWPCSNQFQHLADQHRFSYMTVTKAEGAVAKLSDTLTIVGGAIAGLLEIFTEGIGSLPLAALTVGMSSVASAMSITAGSMDQTCWKTKL